MSGLNNTNSFRQEFQHAVLEIVREIPAGKVITYGIIARLAGRPQHSRLVGRILGNLPENHSCPCHRVVNSKGRPAPHWPQQRQLLEAEKVEFQSNGCVNLKKCLWKLI